MPGLEHNTDKYERNGSPQGSLSAEPTPETTFCELPTTSQLVLWTTLPATAPKRGHNEALVSQETKRDFVTSLRKRLQKYPKQFVHKSVSL